MTAYRTDTLLLAAKVTALILQGICAVAVVVVLLLIPILLAASQGLLTDLFAPDGVPDVAKEPVMTVILCLLLAAIPTAMFVFFGKMRAIIESVGNGDPFIPANAQRLNVMAWLLLAVEILAVLVGVMRARLASATGMAFDSPSYRIYDLDGLLMVVTLFILARIFRHGAAMREDLEGTV